MDEKQIPFGKGKHWVGVIATLFPSPKGICFCFARYLTERVPSKSTVMVSPATCMEWTRRFPSAMV